MIAARDRAKAALARASQLPFRLLDLPMEVVGDISDHLEDEELINLRLVCRALNANSENAFGRRFFRHLVVILHPTSLATLFEICRHPVLSKHVCRITVSGERVGHTIHEIPEEDTQRDLQVSVEHSGMDSLILERVFRDLESLELVQIDVISFYYLDSEPVDDAPEEHSLKKRRGDSGMSRVYDLVLQALHKANVHDKIGLGFEFWNTEYSSKDMIAFFELDTAVWKDYFSKQVRHVSVLGHVSHGWLQKLLGTASDLRKIEFHGENHFLELSHQPTGPFHWPGFSRINLDDLFLPHNEWTNFLRLHAATLKHLSCSSVGFTQGNWIEPLQVIETMPRIEYLWLFRLLEKVPYPHSPMTVRRWSKDDAGVLQLFDPEQVELALSAMRSQPRTAFMGTGIKSEAGGVYLHRVAFDVGEAALDGDIVYRNGDWVFAEVAAYG